MAKNIESQGVRVGYIIGGIIALLVSAFLIILYFPTFLASAFGLPLLWDLSTPISGLIGENFMEMINTWGIVGILTAMMLVYFVSFAARPSKSAVMFRLVGLFGVLGVMLPYVAAAVLSMTEIDLTGYVGYAVLAFFVLALVFYILGMIFRAKQKYHKNKASTALVFCATFWFLFVAVVAFCQVATLFNIKAILPFAIIIQAFLAANTFSILGLFFLVAGIWMLLTVPHHVRVEYNADTPSLQSGKPKVLSKDNSLSPAELAAANERSAEALAESGAPVTQPLSAYPDKPTTRGATKGKVLPNPYRRYPIQPIPATIQQPAQPFGQPQPRFGQPAMPAQQPFGQQPPRPIPQPRQVNPQPNFNQQPRPQNMTQPLFRQPAQNNNPNMITPQNPYNNMRPNGGINPNQPNFNPMNRQNPQAPRPTMQNQQPQPQNRPQPMRPMTQPNQGGRPVNPQPARPQINPYPNQGFPPRQPNGQQPIRPANVPNPNMAPNNFGNQPRPNPNYQPWPQNNPNNVIPNNLRPNNNPNGNNGNNGW